MDDLRNQFLYDQPLSETLPADSIPNLGGGGKKVTLLPLLFSN